MKLLPLWRLALGLQRYVVSNLSMANRESSRSVCIPGGFGSTLPQNKSQCSGTAGRVYITKTRYSNGNASYHSMITCLKTIASDILNESQGNFKRPTRSPSPASLHPGSTKPPANTYHSRTVSQTGREAEGSQQFLAPAPQSRAPTKPSSQSASTSNHLPSFSDGMKRNTPTAHIVNRPASVVQGLL